MHAICVLARLVMSYAASARSIGTVKTKKRANHREQVNDDKERPPSRQNMNAAHTGHKMKEKRKPNKNLGTPMCGSIFEAKSVARAQKYFRVILDNIKSYLV